MGKTQRARASSGNGRPELWFRTQDILANERLAARLLAVCPRIERLVLRDTPKFRAAVRRYAVERCASTRRDIRNGRLSDDSLIPFRRALLSHEQLAVLAMIHDSLAEKSPPIDPWHDLRRLDLPAQKAKVGIQETKRAHAYMMLHYQLPQLALDDMEIIHAWLSELEGEDGAIAKSGGAARSSLDFVESLDQELDDIRQAIKRGDDLADIQVTVQQLCDRTTHRGRAIGSEPNKLLGSGWEAVWRDEKRLMCGPMRFLVVNRLINDREEEYLAAVYRQFMRLLFDGESRLLQREINEELVGAIARYLSLRGWPDEISAAIDLAPGYFDPQMEARDKWVYEQAIQAVKWEAIKIKLRSQNEAWSPVSTISGIKKAAARYAKAKGVPPVPRRQRGRPVRK